MGNNTSSVLRQVSQEEREEQEYARLVDDVEAARRARLITPQNPLQELLNLVQTQNRVSAVNGLPTHQHTSHTSSADASHLMKQAVTPSGSSPAQPSEFGEGPGWTTLCLPSTGNSNPLFLGSAPRQMSDGSHTALQSSDESDDEYIITSMCKTCDMKSLILTQVTFRGGKDKNRADDGSGLRQLFLDDS